MSSSPQRTDLDFKHFRKLLTEERNHLLREHRKESVDRAQESADFNVNELSTYDTNEPGDVSQQIFDRGLDETLDANTRAMIQHIDKALSRLDDGTYGLSEISGAPIPIERLRALPWATTTVDEAERTE